jgi:hypothetical protein
VPDIGVGCGEALRYIRSLALEQEHRTVYWIGKSAAENQLTSFHERTGVLQVRGSEWLSPHSIVADHIVEEQVVHRVSHRPREDS